jgi:hypothetical protein
MDIKETEIENGDEIHLALTNELSHVIIKVGIPKLAACICELLICLNGFILTL